jgi:Uma2 family endonuclease
MVTSTPKRLTLAQYINHPNRNDRPTELVDGIIIDLGAENPINNTIAIFLISQFLQLGIPYYRLANGHQLAVRSSQATARQPDLIVHTEASAAAILAGATLLTVTMPLPLLVVEVVSKSDTDAQSRDRDYIQKWAEYAQRGIPEYWIIDPIAATVWVLTLQHNEYQAQEFMGETAIASPTFPDLQLTASQVLCVA